jgi:hypothetical protein
VVAEPSDHRAVVLGRRHAPVDDDGVGYLQWFGLLALGALLVIGLLPYRLRIRHRSGVLTGHAAEVPVTATEVTELAASPSTVRSP